jgi:predicted GTPase
MGIHDIEPNTSPPPPYKKDVVPNEKVSDTAQPKEEKPINVLIVGETQNGKSTLVKQIGVYAGVPNIDVQVGSGMSSFLPHPSLLNF